MNHRPGWSSSDLPAGTKSKWGEAKISYLLAKKEWLPLNWRPTCFFFQIINFTQKRNLVLGLFYHNIPPFLCPRTPRCRWPFSQSPCLPSIARASDGGSQGHRRWLSCCVKYHLFSSLPWGKDFRWVETTIVGIDLSLRDPFCLIIYFNLFHGSYWSYWSWFWINMCFLVVIDDIDLFLIILRLVLGDWYNEICRLIIYWYCLSTQHWT